MQTCNQNPFLTQSLKISVCPNLGYYYSHWVCLSATIFSRVIHFCQIRLKRDMNTTKQRKGEEWRRILKVWNKQNSLISVSNINYYEATNYFISSSLIFYYLVGYACSHLLSCAVLSIIVHKPSTGVDQVHNDGVVYLWYGG